MRGQAMSRAMKGILLTGVRSSSRDELVEAGTGMRSCICLSLLDAYHVVDRRWQSHVVRLCYGSCAVRWDSVGHPGTLIFSIHGYQQFKITHKMRSAHLDSLCLGINPQILELLCTEYHQDRQPL